MNSYIDAIKVTDKNGNKSILYPNTKKEAVYGLLEDLEKLSVPDITATMDVVMPNSHDGRFLFKKIGGVCEQVTTAGNQLFDFTELAYKSHIIEEENGFIKFSNNTSANEYPTHTYNLPKGNYTVSLEIQSNSNSTIYVASSVSDYSRPITGVGKHTINFSEVELVWVCIAGKDGANMKLRIMINSGTTALPYEPYTGGIPAPSPSYPQEIKKSVVSGVKTHGKNLLNVELVDGTIAGVTYKLNVDKSITVSGTRTGGSHYRVGSAYLKTGNYIYGIAKGSFQNIVSVITKPDGTTFTNSFPCLVTVTEENEGLYDFNLKGITNDVACSGTGYLQVEEDNTITEYEPYTESTITLSQPIELYGISDVQDVITPKPIKRRYMEISISSEATILINDGFTKDNTIAFYIAISNKAMPYSKVKAMCSHFEHNASLSSADTECFRIGDNVIYFRVNKARLSSLDVDGAKSFLAEIEPIKVVYELATETTEELPTADQIALNSLATYDGVTYLEFDSEIEPTFESEYGTSKVGGMTLESLLTARNNDLRLSSLEASVVNNI